MEKSNKQEQNWQPSLSHCPVSERLKWTRAFSPYPTLFHCPNGQRTGSGQHRHGVHSLLRMPQTRGSHSFLDPGIGGKRKKGEIERDPGEKVLSAESERVSNISPSSSSPEGRLSRGFGRISQADTWEWGHLNERCQCAAQGARVLKHKPAQRLPCQLSPRPDVGRGSPRWACHLEPVQLSMVYLNITHRVWARRQTPGCTDRKVHPLVPLCLPGETSMTFYQNSQPEAGWCHQVR